MQQEFDKMQSRAQARRRRQALKKRRRRIFVMAVAVLAVAIFVGVFASLCSCEGNNNTTTQATEPPEPTYTVIDLVFGGDVIACDRVSTIADLTDAFLDVAAIFAGADASAVNFEGNIAGRESLANALAAAGVDFAQAANSDTISQGLTGLQATLNGLCAAGLEPLGAFESPAEFEKTQGFTLKNIGGIKVAFVAFTKGMEGLRLPAGGENCVNLLYKDYDTTYKKIDTEGITAILQAVAAQKPDVTVAMLHWGSEYNSTVSSGQEKIVELMQANGVDAIVGTHPHVVQRVAFDEEKGTVVAYSLGDLLGPGEHTGSNYSILLNLQVTKNDLTGEVKLTGCTYEPVYTLSPAESGAGVKIVRIRQAMAMYENNHVGKVSKTAYDNMKAALAKIEKQTAG